MHTLFPPWHRLWKGVAYHFDIEVPEEYPHKQPDVKLREKVRESSLALAAWRLALLACCM